MASRSTAKGSSSGSKMIHVGFIGTGVIMQRHAGFLREYDDVVLAAAADPSKPALKAKCEEFEIAGQYTDYEKMLAAENLDAVFVCVPNSLHSECSTAALRAGAHVLCEKPPAMNAQEVAKMVRLAKKGGQRLFFGLHHRYRPPIQAARSYMEQGRFGEMYHGETTWFRRRGIPGLGRWFTTKAESGGGAMIDIGVHFLDAAHFMMGNPKPVAVSAVTHNRFLKSPKDYLFLDMWAGPPNYKGKFDVDDLAAALFRFENGGSLVLQVSWAVNFAERADMAVAGEKGGASIRNSNVTIHTEDNGYISDIIPQLPAESGPKYLVRHFLECLRNPKIKPISGGHDGLVLQSMLDAVYKSAETGREQPVKIPEIQG